MPPPKKIVNETPEQDVEKQINTNVVILENEQLREELEKCTQGRATLLELNTTLSKKLCELRKMYDTLLSSYKTSQEQLRERSTTYATSLVLIDSVHDEKKDDVLKSQKKELKGEFKTERQKLEAKIKKLEGEIEALQQENEVLKAKLKLSLDAHTQPLIAKNDKLKKELNAWQKNCDDLEKECNKRIDDQRRQQKMRVSQLKDDLKSRIKDLETSISQRWKDIFIQEEKLEKKTAELQESKASVSVKCKKSYSAAISKQQKEKNCLQDIATFLRLQLNGWKRELSVLDKEMQNLQNTPLPVVHVPAPPTQMDIANAVQVEIANMPVVHVPAPPTQLDVVKAVRTLSEEQIGQILADKMGSVDINGTTYYSQLQQQGACAVPDSGFQSMS